MSEHILESLSQDEARQLAERFDRRLLRLEKEQAQALVLELRRARSEIVERMTLAGEITQNEMWRLEGLLREIDLLIAELEVRLGNVISGLPEAATALGDEFAGGVLGVRIIATFSMVNRPVLVTLQQYDLGLIRGITSDLREEIRRELMQGIIQGEDMRQIANRLVKGTRLTRGPWPKVETRAEVIARTETLRAFNQGARWQFQQYGVKRVMWLTAKDERTCPYCRPLDGQIFPLDRIPLGGPPIHPRCVPGNTRVTATGISAVSKRPYDGDLVVIRTASGKHLACTPNHPVLTPAGWVAAGLLDEGSYVISSSGSEWEGFANYNNKYMPPRIEDIAETFRRSKQVAAMPVPVTSEDFHGDGIGSKIAVIWTDRLLVNHFDATQAEHSSQFGFGWRDMEGFLLDSFSVFELGRHRNFAAACGSMGGGHLTNSLLTAHPRPLDEFSLTVAPYLDTSLQEAMAYYGSANIIPFCQGLFGFTGEIKVDKLSNWHLNTLFEQFNRCFLPDWNAGFSQAFYNDTWIDTELLCQIIRGAAGQVFTDKIIHIERYPFHGYVFNLQTESGMYVANGIITHNCRCVTVAHIEPDEAKARQADREAAQNYWQEQKRLTQRKAG